MYTKIFIDVLKGKEQYKSLTNESFRVTYVFYNILYYAKEKYSLTVVDLAKIFNVKRQTIYNYFRLNTKDLPESIKREIASIYKVNTFDEVLDKELLVNKVEITENDIVALASSGNLNSLDSKFLEVINFDSLSKKESMKFNEDYDLKKLWHLKLTHNSLIYSNKIEDDEMKQLEDFFSNNTKEYNVLLIELLNSISNNDREVILLLRDYIQSTSSKENLKKNGIVSKTKEDIKKAIDTILNQKGLINVDMQDFKSFDNVLFHAKYIVRDSNEFYPSIDVSFTKNKNVIVNIASNNIMSVSIISDVLDKIKDIFEVELDIIFGNRIKKDSDDLEIDIFILNE